MLAPKRQHVTLIITYHAEQYNRKINKNNACNTLAMLYNDIHQLETRRQKMYLLHGAYGRHYATITKLLEDWNAGKDFKIWNGPYCSIRDLKTMKSEGKRVVLAYGNDNFYTV